MDGVGRVEAHGSSRRRGYHRPMPIYEFLCEACGSRFEELVDAGTESVDCRACTSRRTRRVYSAQGRPFSLVKTPGEARRQERLNAQLRERTKQRLGADRRRARQPEERP
jgi:putative FmdB family regulatory protein